MQGTPSFFKSSPCPVQFSWFLRCAGLAIALLLVSCQSNPSSIEQREVHIHQGWELQPGNSIAGHPIVAGLGDISVRLAGRALYAPFDGKIEPAEVEDCVIFSSPQVPAYLLRFCGLSRPRLGDVAQGDRIGRGRIVHLATLRKQPDGTWALVEPSLRLIESALTPP